MRNTKYEVSKATATAQDAHTYISVMDPNLSAPLRAHALRYPHLSASSRCSSGSILFLIASRGRARTACTLDPCLLATAPWGSMMRLADARREEWLRRSEEATLRWLMKSGREPAMKNA